MADFLGTQLDFIYFFYGLAFILLGTTCFAIAGAHRQDGSWAVLGSFGFAHGISEWLDLIALIVGDTPAFALARTVVMAGSFVVLLEFARREGRRLGFALPGSWIHAPLLLAVAVAGGVGDTAAAGAVARYVFGLTGALATSAVFAEHARRFSGATRGVAILASIGFAMYGIAAGAIVPVGPFWSSPVLTYPWFVQLTGLPIQLVRGLLACWITFSIWVIWGQHLVREVASDRYTAYLRRQFAWTMLAMGLIMAGGWILTDRLGDIYKQTVKADALGDLDLLTSRLAGETAPVESMVRSLAGSPSVRSMLTGRTPSETARAIEILTLDVTASGAAFGLVLDRSGNSIAGVDQRDGTRPGVDFSTSPVFLKAIAGESGNHFVFDPVDQRPLFHTGRPVRAEDGTIVGVAVLAKSLEVFEADLAQFKRPYFLIDADGVVMLTNRPAMWLRTLWPLPAERRAELARRFPGLDARPVMDQEVVDATWTSVDGEPDYVRRRHANNSQWSLVILKPTRELFASRVFGLVVTLLITVTALIYMFGRERAFHNSIQLDKRLHLQELTRNLRFQATTDPLTGLNNRLLFNDALAHEMARASRYRTPLSLVLFDIDDFKVINDTHGHPIGDEVLVRMGDVMPAMIRDSDVLARWGGEEFVLLLPGSDGTMACRAAEKLRAGIGSIAFDRIGSLTCSFGVAVLADGDTTDTLVARADAALYRAKLNGRDRVELAPPPPPVSSAA